MSIFQVQVEGRQTYCNKIQADIRSYANRSWQWLKSTVKPYAEVPKSLLFRLVSSSVGEVVGGELVKRSLRAVTIYPPSWVAPTVRLGGTSAAIGFGLNTIYFLPTSKANRIGLAILLTALVFGSQEMMLESGPDLGRAIRDGLGDILGGYGALWLLGNRPDFGSLSKAGYAPSMIRFLLAGHIFERVITVPTSLGAKLIFTVPRLLSRNIVQLSAFSSPRLWPIIRYVLKGKVRQGPLLCDLAKMAAERYCLKTSSSIIELSSDRINPFLEVFSENFNRFLETHFITPLSTGFQAAASSGAVNTVNVLSHTFIQFTKLCQSPDLKRALQSCLGAFRKEDRLEIDSSIKNLQSQLNILDHSKNSLLKIALNGAFNLINYNKFQDFSIQFVNEIANMEKQIIGIRLMGESEKHFLRQVAPIFMQQFCGYVILNWDKFSGTDVTKEREKELIDCLHQLFFNSYFRLILPVGCFSVINFLTQKVVNGFKASQELVTSFNSDPEESAKREPASLLIDGYFLQSEVGDDFDKIEGEQESEQIKDMDREWDPDAIKSEESEEGTALVEILRDRGDSSESEFEEE